MHGRILIVDDVATNRIIYKVKLDDAFYEPLLAADGRSCLAIAREQRPDLTPIIALNRLGRAAHHPAGVNSTRKTDEPGQRA